MAPVSGNGMVQRILCVVAATLLGALLLAWVTTTGGVRVNASALGDTNRRVDRLERAVQLQALDLAEIKADVRATRAVVERMEGR